MSTIVEMSQAEYARHRGLTPKAIEKAIVAGRIPASAVRRDGRQKLIDVAAADLSWPHSNVRVNTPLDFAGASPSMASDGDSAPPRETPGLTKARTEAAQIETRLKELQLEQRLGKLLLTDDVARSMERCAEMIVRDIDQLHARADDLVTAYTRNGAAGVRALLKDISRGMRETLAANMRMLAAEDGGDEEAADVDPLVAEQQAAVAA